MKKINLFDSNDRKVQVSLVRFFKFNNDMYFIYTYCELYEKNYFSPRLGSKKSFGARKAA